MVLMGLSFLVPLGSVSSAAGRVGLVLAACLGVAVGVWAWRGSLIAVRVEGVEIRSALFRHRVPLEAVRACVAEIGSKGLIYTRAYPVVELFDGTRIAAYAVQWLPADVEAARSACADLTRAIQEYTTRSAD